MRRIWPGLGYMGLTLVMTWPTVLHLGRRIVAPGNDAWIFWWNDWWLDRALAGGQQIFRTDFLFHPHGVSLTYHSFSLLNSALWIALKPMVGPVAAYNLTFLIVFPIAAIGMAWLVRDLTGSRSAAFVAGLVFAFVPYRLAHAHHPNLMGTEWIPFFTLFLIRALRDGRRRDILAAAGFLVLTALVGMSLLLYLVLWTAWIALAFRLAGRASWARVLGVSAAAFALALIVLSPILVPMMESVGHADSLGAYRPGDQQSDLVAYVLPANGHPIWGDAVAPLYERLSWPRFTVNPGYVPLALLGLLLLTPAIRRRTRMWWGALLFWWLMALGRVLKVMGEVHHEILLPFNLVYRLYFFRMLKVPDRANLLLAVPLAVLVGFAVAHLLRRAGPVRARLLVGGISALFLLESLALPVERRAPEVSAFHERIAHEAGEFAVVDAPLDFHREGKLAMLAQTVHGRPIASGHVSRRPASATAFIESNALLRRLTADGDLDLAPGDLATALRTVAGAGFRYVIVRRAAIDAERLAVWRRWLGDDPVHEDGEYVAFRIPGS